MTSEPDFLKKENKTPREGKPPDLFREREFFEPKKVKLRIWALSVISAMSFAAVILVPRHTLEGEATLQGEKFLKVNATSSGVLERLFFETGAFAKEGETVLRFGNPEFGRALESKKEELQGLKHEREKLGRKAEFLEKTLSGKKILFENKVIGALPYEEANLQFQESEEELKSVEEKEKAFECDIEYLEGKIAGLEVKAPFAGILLTSPKDQVGSFFKEGDFLFEFADPESYFLELLVPEKEIKKIKVGNAVLAHFEAFPKKRFQGVVTQISPRVHEQIERVFKVRRVIPCTIKLEPLPPDIRYGMKARVTVKTNTQVLNGEVHS